MKDYLDRVREMTQNAMHTMFAVEKTGDLEKMDNAAKDYAALCAAVTAMEKQIVKLPKWGKMFYICPTCNHYAGDLDKPPFEHCRFCGQKLKERKAPDNG